MENLSASGVLVRNLSLIPPDPRLPEEANRQFQALLASRHWIWRTMAFLEASSAFESWAEVRRANITSLGDILLVVMISTEPVALTESPELSRRADLAWRELQRGLVHESARGKLVAAQNSSHFIQLDQSELVVETIRQAAAIEHVQTGNNLKCLYDNHRC